jgi:hypothetical protein
MWASERRALLALKLGTKKRQLHVPEAVWHPQAVWTF